MAVRTPNLKYSDGADVGIERLGNQGDQLVSMLHGYMHETSQAYNLYWAASQAATTWSVALATTHTGFCLSNPAGSGKLVVPRFVGFALSAAPVAIASVHVGGGYLAAGVTVHTTPLTVYSSRIGDPSAPTAAAKADGAATLVGTPLYILPIQGGFTAAALPGVTTPFGDLHGAVQLIPGAYCFVAALTAAVGFACMFWEEVTL
jgi:hypothetical protein